ncbi:4-hydroxy-tetrahydrodipicolinate synthase [Streptococcus thoraltensis]|uniref:4-hydroxy-tetrahydrodipicolinate synthase n=1 Tax=Streptococcus thoraltensis TaxID=55085 RepID=UPI0003616D94|nr:4-hydroxy-tetrahydrodipicolinate synthase [Streptococcus thoraltensis]MDY4761509.1 4-hydroxy-tetrahydrodipicolinate synthase [Streptococcus thoraltensis]
MVKIEGIIAPIITPMNEDESINLNEFRNQVDRLIDNGIHGIFVFGTNGESYILSEEEKLEVIKVAVEQADGRVPIYAGTGLNGTKETIRFSLKVKELGVDALSIITPGFAAASQDELYEHFKAVAEAVDLPIILYNIPSRTGNTIAPVTVGKLSEIPNIVGVKDSSGNFDNILQYIEQSRNAEDFVVLSGNDSLILWTLLAGGSGAIAACSNVYPYTLSQIYEQFVEGNIEKSRQYQDSIRSFRNLFAFGNPNTIVKYGVAELGHPVGKARAPFNHLSAEGLEALRQVLANNKKNGMK